MSNAGMFNFEKLDVWQKAIDFADLVYNRTRGFPADERFGLNQPDATRRSFGVLEHCRGNLANITNRFRAIY
jgi:S23 ribosomal protein.